MLLLNSLPGTRRLDMSTTYILGLLRLEDCSVLLPCPGRCGLVRGERVATGSCCDACLPSSTAPWTPTRQANQLDASRAHTMVQGCKGLRARPGATGVHAHTRSCNCVDTAQPVGVLLVASVAHMSSSWQIQSQGMHSVRGGNLHRCQLVVTLCVCVCVCVRACVCVCARALLAVAASRRG